MLRSWILDPRFGWHLGDIISELTESWKDLVGCVGENEGEADGADVLG